MKEIGTYASATVGGRKRDWRVWLLIAATVLYTVNLTDAISPWISRCRNREDSGTDPFQWNKIRPSRQLEYTSCYDGFQCARLDVPLNWNSTAIDSVARVAVAIVKLPAKVPVTDERYGGAILMNPGGPGESGVHQVLSGGKHVQTIVDSPTMPGTINASTKYFDIIGFDPRGVDNTTPPLRCFPDAFKQQAWLLAYPDYSLLWDSDSIIGLELARSKVLGESCSRELSDGDIIKYTNTAQVVEDMVEIIERHGQWREREFRKMMKEVQNQRHTPGYTRSTVERARWRKGKERLQYWGFSYGTIVGQTFAAMHPDRVGALVIDGVVDPEDYYAGTALKNLLDSDKVVTKFCEYCYEAGPEKCPLFTGSSAKDVEARFERIMLNLKISPISAPGTRAIGPQIVTYGDILLRMLNAIYFSYTAAEDFFHILANLESGNVDKIAADKEVVLEAEQLSAGCLHDGPFSDACGSQTYISALGAIQSIACMDAGGRINVTQEDLKDYLTELRAQSKWLSTSWARNKIGCVGFTVLPAWSYTGPIMGNTSHPLLIIGNTHDPVCPLSNARHVSTLFPSSIVVQQDSEGHCSYSNPSICTGKVVRHYFQTGQLPQAGTVCEPEYKPFIGCLQKDEEGRCRSRDAEEETMWEAMKAITAGWP